MTESAAPPLIIDGNVIEPGTEAQFEINAARLYTHARVGIPVLAQRGREPGPVLFVSAAIHGDEINGVEIIRRLTAATSPDTLKGTLLTVPIVNVHGFLAASRNLPDRRDMNRCFPGKRDGSLASHLAWLFMRHIASNCTHGIDLHTAAFHRVNFPQIRCSLDFQGNLALARAFGAPVILDSALRDDSLRQAVTEIGKPMLVYEAGEALRFDERAIETGLRGVLSVMKHLGMLAENGETPIEPFIARSSRWVRAPQSGILRIAAELGSEVRRGQRLGSLSGPLGENEATLIAPFDGVVIGRLELPLVHKGDAVCHLARLEGSEGELPDPAELDDFQFLSGFD